MDFTPTSDQDMLQQSVRKMLARACATEQLREMIDSPTTIRSLWTLLADTGIFSLRNDEASGGVGFGCAEAVLVFEELGAALVPGPLVWTHLAGSVLPSAANGSRLVGGVHRSDPLHVLEHAGLVDDVVILDNDGVWLVDARDIAVEIVIQPLDPLTPIGIITDLPRGRQIADAATAGEWQRIGCVLTSALLVGIGSTATTVAVDYAKERQQFGRAIGSFQAIKHILADMLARAEVARAAVRSAGVHLDDAELASAASRSTAVAKIVATEAGVHNTKDCIQVHGGIGFTWEAHPQLLAKRAQVHATAFGTIDELADHLFD